MIQILIKITVCTFIVVALAEISKKVDPFIGGILSGLPLGTGLAVFFIAKEQGISYMTKGIPWGIAGLTGSMVFCATYLYSAKVNNKSLLFRIPCTSLPAFLSFVLWGIFLTSIELNIVNSVIIFLIMYLANIAFIERFIKHFPVSASDSKDPGHIFIRGILAGAIITAITLIAAFTGSKGAGIVSAFPSVLYTVIVILHAESGITLFPQVIRGFSVSISTLAFFYIASYFILPKISLTYAFVIVYILSFIYLYLFHHFRSLIIKIKNS